MKRLRPLGALVALVAGVVPATAAGAAAPPTSPPYLTLLLAHSAWTATDEQCKPLKGIVDLGEQAAALAKRHLKVTASVITTWVADGQRTCITHRALKPSPKPLLIASWADLQRLKSDDGWSFISHSRTYRTITTLRPAQQRAEACGSLADLQRHGFPEAAGMFAYPNDQYTDQLQTSIVSTCYDFGRVYRGPQNMQATMGSPWLASATSFNGGRCADKALPCSTLDTPYAYSGTPWVTHVMNPNPGQWNIAQFYRFATGSNLTGDTLRWDCRGPDWRTHWTNNTELYCWSDYLAAIDHIGSAVRTIDPAGVAAAWGRSSGDSIHVMGVAGRVSAPPAGHTAVRRVSRPGWPW